MSKLKDQKTNLEEFQTDFESDSSQRKHKINEQFKINDAVSFVYDNNLKSLLEAINSKPQLLSEVDDYGASIIGAIFEEYNTSMLEQIKLLNIDQKYKLESNIKESIIDALFYSEIPVREAESIISKIYECQDIFWDTKHSGESKNIFE